MQFVPVFLTPGVDGVWLNPLCGMHFMQVNNTGTQTAIALLQCLARQVDNGEPVNIKHLVSADRDRLLAHVYQQEYGSKVESTVSCKNCKAKFDIDFSLPALVASRMLQPHAAKAAQYNLENVAVFRLPTGEDELFALQTPNDMVGQILQRCVGTTLRVEESLLVQQKMEAIAPMLQMDVTAVCTECGAENEKMFDMQQFLLTRMMHEQTSLIGQVHLIALHYHWHYHEIINLPRQLIHRYASHLSA